MELQMLGQNRLSLLLSGARSGDRTAQEDLFGLLYRDAKNLAHDALAKERSGHTLQTTALVHEVFLRLVGQVQLDWDDEGQFRAIVSQLLRRILVDHARSRHAAKRGGHVERVSLGDPELSGLDDEGLIELDDALSVLGRLNERQAQVAEQKLFGGLTGSEIARCLGVSERTVKADWRFAKQWLRTKLAP